MSINRFAGVSSNVNMGSKYYLRLYLSSVAREAVRSPVTYCAVLGGFVILIAFAAYCWMSHINYVGLLKKENDDLEKENDALKERNDALKKTLKNNPVLVDGQQCHNNGPSTNSFGKTGDVKETSTVVSSLTPWTGNNHKESYESTMEFIKAFLSIQSIVSNYDKKIVLSSDKKNNLTHNIVVVSRYLSDSKENSRELSADFLLKKGANPIILFQYFLLTENEEQKKRLLSSTFDAKDFKTYRKDALQYIPLNSELHNFLLNYEPENSQLGKEQYKSSVSIPCIEASNEASNEASCNIPLNVSNYLRSNISFEENENSRTR